MAQNDIFQVNNDIFFGVIVPSSDTEKRAGGTIYLTSALKLETKPDSQIRIAKVFRMRCCTV